MRSDLLVKVQKGKGKLISEESLIKKAVEEGGGVKANDFYEVCGAERVTAGVIFISLQINLLS